MISRLRRGFLASLEMTGAMKQQIIFASNNPHKLKEIRAILPPQFEVAGLQDIGFFEDIPEPYPTLEENALEKARFIYHRFHQNCFADDTGLEVDALDGLPGVLSARFAGASKSSEANISKLLDMLDGAENRKAQFRAVMALILEGKEYLFEGIVRGHIATETSGAGGFGYDPIFIPEGYQQTFAVMPDEQKNRLSHRYEALKKMVAFLHSM